MSCDVFANCNEIACKAGSCKVIAAFPDVCLTPPSPPAGPIPIPYPDTSFSKDMMNGSKTVKIKGQEVMLKDQSFYKTMPLGDEAATQGLGAGVITHVITGKTYFNMWSMDVKFEGRNVDRHLDITTSNHASMPPNEGVPMPTLGMMAAPALLMSSDDDDPCEKAKKEKKRACESIPTLKKGKKVIENLENEKMTAHLQCPEILARIKGFDDCLAARSEVTKHCFEGVTDKRHADEEDALRRGRAKTQTLATKKGC